MMSRSSHPCTDPVSHAVRKPGRALLAALAGLALLSIPGCQQDRIETHRLDLGEPPEPKLRLLGAMLPHDKEIWFFKVVGNLDAVGPLAAPFEELVRSVRVDKPG